MAVSPVHESDNYGKGFEAEEDAKKFHGTRKLNFGGIRSDAERMAKINEHNLNIDCSPTVPEVKAWNMRPRRKEFELGPPMKYNDHLQG